MADVAVHHMAIACRDPRALERFYTRHFGFRRARAIPLDQDEIVFIKSGAIYLEIFQAKQEAVTPRADKDGPIFPGWRHIAFQVDDIDAKLTEMGTDATVTLGPLDFGEFIPGWRTVWVSDPEGNIVEISQGYVDDPAEEEA
jgi:glyoxylase I family protein